MGAIVEAISTTLVGMIEAIATGISGAVSQLIFVPGADGSQELSDFAKFAFAIFGVSLGITLVFFVVNWIRGR